VDPIPEPLLRKQFRSTGNRTKDLWVSSQKFWPLGHISGVTPKTKFQPNFASEESLELVLWLGSLALTALQSVPSAGYHLSGYWVPDRTATQNEQIAFPRFGTSSLRSMLWQTEQCNVCCTCIAGKSCGGNVAAVCTSGDSVIRPRSGLWWPLLLGHQQFAWKISIRSIEFTHTHTQIRTHTSATHYHTIFH
jgi:hypothetical protein